MYATDASDLDSVAAVAIAIDHSIEGPEEKHDSVCA
jgi:hypothetical protein